MVGQIISHLRVCYIIKKEPVLYLLQNKSPEQGIATLMIL